MSSIAMDVYADMIRDDRRVARALRMAPDTIFNLPNHYAVCSWISRGARVPGIRRADDAAGDQRGGRASTTWRRSVTRGGYVPDRLPDPLPDSSRPMPRELPIEAIGAGEDGSSTSAPLRTATGTAATRAPEPMALDFDATSIDSPMNAPRPAAARRAGKLHRARPRRRARARLGQGRGACRRTAGTSRRKRELEILAALWRYRVLFATPDLAALVAGQLAARRPAGAQPDGEGGLGAPLQVPDRRARRPAARVLPDAATGFELAQQHTGRARRLHRPGAKWREPQLDDPRRVLRDLHVNGWVLALRAGRRQGAASRLARPRDGRLEPPRRRVRGEWVDMRRPSDVVVGPAGGSATSTPARVRAGHARRDRSSCDRTSATRRCASTCWSRSSAAGRRGASEERLQRYDALISGWAGCSIATSALGTPPVVVFVCEDEPSRTRLVRMADRAVAATDRQGGRGDEAEWPFPGRAGDVLRRSSATSTWARSRRCSSRSSRRTSARSWRGPTPRSAGRARCRSWSRGCWGGGDDGDARIGRRTDS